MSLDRWIIVGLWLLFVVYWAVAAVGIKRSSGGHPWRREIGLRIALILLVAALLQSRSLRLFLAQTRHHLSHSALLGWSGLALCLSGFALAISARRHLGRNWGMPMSRKEQPELVTSGPYALIRHPIYTGLILAMLGSAIAINIFWVAVLVIVSAYFVYSARSEEAVMLQLFPEQYAAYKARTGMLVPCPLRRGGHR
jgi:protein-S-isoprenylcysteine O-methyltransferase Ste14